MIRGLLAVAALSVACHAQGALMIIAEEVGGNVVITGSGSLDLSGLTKTTTNIVFARVNPSASTIVVGSTSARDLYAGDITSPTDFGPGTGGFANSGSDGLFGFNQGSGIVVPAGYVSGDLSGTSTWNGETFASLGMTPGTYIWSWAIPDTPNIETITLQVGPVPEPSTLAVFAIGGIGIGAGGIRRRRKQIAE